MSPKPSPPKPRNTQPLGPSSPKSPHSDDQNTLNKDEGIVKSNVIIYIVPDHNEMAKAVTEYENVKKWAKTLRSKTSKDSLLWCITRDMPAPIGVSRGGGMWGYPFRVLSYLQQAGWGLIEVYRLGGDQYAFLMGNIASNAIHILNDDAIPDSIQFVATVEDEGIREWMKSMSSVATRLMIIENNEKKESHIDRTN